MIIASWNVNSIRARMPHVLRWLNMQPVDVLLLQEIKCESATFPAAELQALGYSHQKILGEKSYNGVALLSRTPISEETHALPGDAADTQARFIGGRVQGVLLYNLYAPNGNPLGNATEPSEKFAYKLRWLARLQELAGQIWAQETPAVFAGDFNIIPTARDAKTPSAWVSDALFQPESRAAFATLTNAGWTDAYRAFNRDENGYTFFDYRAGAWQKRDGIRIDHMLLSPEAADRSTRCWIDITPRGWETPESKPSDHVPILLEIAA